MKHNCLKSEPVAVLIPNGIVNLEKAVSGTGLQPDRIRLILEQIRLARLMSMSTSNWKKNTQFSQGWTSLHSKILIKAGTDEYSKYMTWLIENKIIEVRKNANGTKSYSVNGKSQQFRIAPEILKPINGKYFHREIITDYKTIKSVFLLKKYFGDKPIKKSSLVLTDIHHQLIYMMSEVKFNMELFDKIRHTPDFFQSFTSDKLGMLDEYRELMEAINEGEIKFATVDRFGERLHTPYSNLWGTLRKFIYFKNSPNDSLVVLDFANSQPYFSSVCTSTKFIEEILPEFINCIPIITNANTTDDFSSFVRMCSDGTIYDFWSTARGIKRENAKEEIINIIMFGKPKSTLAVIRKTRKIFGAHFPSVLKMFDQIKTTNADDLPFIKTLYIDKQNNFTGRKDLYKNLSCMMQRAESRMVIGKIAPALIKAGLVPFITVHDSFIVLQQHEEKVRKVIQEEFEKLVVQPPKVKSTKIFVPLGK